ncbi:MAG: KH domain-containing protein [Acholeplasmatales bacterium]|nr:KH domain-containing protein [Acholeplasmatales bacterium]
MTINFEELIKNMVAPLVVNPNDIVVKTLDEDEELLTIQVLVNKEDLGRVIGKNGKIAQAIRTIAYAGASKEGKRIKIDIDSF